MFFMSKRVILIQNKTILTFIYGGILYVKCYIWKRKCPRQVHLDTRVYFRRYSNTFDFYDPFIQSVISGIDKAEVIANGAIKDYRGLFLSVDKLSTGSKTLCSIYFDKEGRTFYGSMMGDNCAPYLMEIARNKNVTVFYEHFMPIPVKYFDEGLIQKVVNLF